jgi:hypothetical protein
MKINEFFSAFLDSPGAVQVELAPDLNSSSLRLLGPPEITVGFTKIRISTESYQKPVQMVRLYLKRPPDSCSIG